MATSTNVRYQLVNGFEERALVCAHACTLLYCFATKAAAPGVQLQRAQDCDLDLPNISMMFHIKTYHTSLLSKLLPA